MARPERFELPTPRFEAWCSIQLSYERLVEAAKYRKSRLFLPAPWNSFILYICTVFRFESIIACSH